MQIPWRRYLIAALSVAAMPCSAGEQFQDLSQIARAAEAHAQTAARQQRYRDIRVRALALDARLSLGACGHQLETFSAPGPAAGRSTVGVRCNAPKPWTIYVPVQVDASVETVVLRESLPRGSILAAGDLAVKLQPAAAVYGELVSSIASATGKQLRRNTAADKALTLRMLTAPEAVGRGQTTQILSVVNNIEVVMNGTAMSKGSAGDVIKVRNNASGRLLEGVVTADGRVRVH